MTNKIAIGIGLLIVLGLSLDYALQDWGGTVFLGRKFADLIEWLAFWR
nr:glyceraldehyde-3-phosphate dehydrogenase [uncultured Roseovarius sp.]